MSKPNTRIRTSTVSGATGFIGRTAVRIGIVRRKQGGALRQLLPVSCADAIQGLGREQWLPLPPETVFPFFADPFNLERITPEFLSFHVLGTTTEEVGEGTLIDYRLRLRGVPIRWRSRIEEWVPGRRFVDRQVKGPYTLWHHTHEFEPYCGGTIVRDCVRYELPFGPLGHLAAGRFVASELERIFDHRSECMRQIFHVFHVSDGREERRLPGRARSVQE